MNVLPSAVPTPEIQTLKTGQPARAYRVTPVSAIGGQFEIIDREAPPRGSAACGLPVDVPKLRQRQCR
jgi:hypothetical protein